MQRVREQGSHPPTEDPQPVAVSLSQIITIMLGAPSIRPEQRQDTERAYSFLEVWGFTS